MCHKQLLLEGAVHEELFTIFRSVLGRTRTCDLLVYRPSRLKTQGYIEGQGEIRGCGSVVV